MEGNNQGKGSKRIYLALIVLLLLINGIAGYLWYNENKQKEEQIVIVQKKDDQIKSINQQLDSTRQELEGQRGKNKDLDSIINVREAQIDETKARLVAAQRRGNLSVAEAKEYKELADKYQAENADLQKTIKELADKNEELTTKNMEVAQKLEAEKNTNASLTEDKKALSRKVELGSLLHVQNLTLTGDKRKKNGKEKEEKSAKKIDYLKISFETGDNKVLEPGKVNLYIRVINPKGETIALADQGSGTIKLADGGGDVQYSRSIDLDWNQTSQKKNIEWSQNVNEPGTYKVEIYQSGYLVGHGSVSLK
jgi:myosin heavy subunit